MLQEPLPRLEKLLDFTLIPSAEKTAINGMEIVSDGNPEAAELKRGFPASVWEVKMWAALKVQERALAELKRENRRLRARLKSKGELR